MIAGNAHEQTTEPLSPAFRRMALTAGATLVMLGTVASISPELASEAYGIPVPNESSRAYMVAAGVRDISLGGIVLAFALLKNKRALGTVMACTSAVAVGDATLAARHSPNPARVLPTHIAGIVGCIGFAWLLLRDA